jgi:hypothetical protein
MAKANAKKFKAIEGNPDAPQIIKQELNLEQWALWTPSRATRSDKSLEPRILTHEDLQPDGIALTKTVEIAHTYKGTLTTRDQKVLLALVKIWEEAGRPLTYVFLSRYRLAQILGLEWGKTANTLIEESLDRLNSVTLTFKESFTDASGKTEKKLSFRILAELYLATREEKTADGAKQIKAEKGYFQFHQRIISNIIRNYAKPVLLDVVLSIGNDIAQLIYSHADRVLSNSNRYEWRTENIVKELALDGKDYHKPSIRKRIFERAIVELNGKPLSSGGLLKVTMVEAKDKTKTKDYKLIFEKRARLEIAATPVPTVADHQLTEAEQLVLYFHRVFFGVEPKKATKRELAQAAELLSLHGFDIAKAVIETAKRDASKTGFAIATFGGVMQYQSKAAATAQARIDYEGKEKIAQAERRQQQAEEDYFRYFEPNFRAFQKLELEQIEEQQPEAYRAFSDWFTKNHAKGLKMVESEMRREEIKTSRAAEFYRVIEPSLGIRMTAFEDWDTEYNTERCDPLENHAHIVQVLMERLGLTL